MTFGQCLGELIQRKRKVAGLTQLQLAEDAFGSGAKTRRISELENGTVANPHPKTIDPIIVTLGISDTELEECARRGQAQIDPDLDRAYREARNLIDAIARQFEHAEPNASLAELDDFLRSKAAEWVALRARIGAMKAEDVAVSRLQDAASAALSQGKFDEVDLLLIQLEEKHQKEKTLEQVREHAQIRITRGDAFLLREQPDAALNLYLSAAGFFKPFDLGEMSDLLDFLAKRIYDSSQRSVKPRFFIAVKLLEELVVLENIQNDRDALARTYYRLGLICRNEAITSSDGLNKDFIERAIGYARLSAEVYAPAEEPYRYVSSHGSLGNILLDLTRIEKDESRLAETISTFRAAKTVALEFDEAGSLLPFVCNSLGAALRLRGKVHELKDEHDLSDDDALKEFEEAARYAKTYFDLEVWGAAKANIARIAAAQSSIEGIDPASRDFLRLYAISEYGSALETYPVITFPLRFADIQWELSCVLYRHADAINSSISEFYLLRAANAAEAAAHVFSVVDHPSKWARIHAHMGTIFVRHSRLEGADTLSYDLDQASKHYEMAREAFTNIGELHNAKVCEDAFNQTVAELAAHAGTIDGSTTP
jgi:transcriptional regulator with XRE-family HTH domain